MLTPINELPPDFEQDSPVAWHFQPTTYLDQNKVGLHLRRTALVARVAGFAGVVVADYQGDQTTYIAESQSIEDVNFDGSVAGTAKGTVVKAATERASLEEWQGSAEIPDFYKWEHAKVAINRTELASRISTRINRGMSQETAWALELDHSLRRGIGQAALAKLKKSLQHHSEPLLTGGLGSVLGGDALIITSGNIAAGSALFLGASYFVQILGDQMTRGRLGFLGLPARAPNAPKRRFSVLPFGIQPDRFVGAAALLSSQRLVQEIR